jgi:phthalate 4,5-dioxygenase oxygenase subunit
MVTATQDRLLTHVEGDAPMGRFMREHHWIPCALGSSLIADGQPRHIRLLGDDYVAFRATDGRVGFLDEACPHRRVSLLLARNEDCGLRCIFHGWKIDVSGKVVDVPSEGDRSAQFAQQVKVNHYPTFENGGLLWVYLGKGALPPRPPLPFFDLAEENVYITRSVAPCNWFQGVEGTIDSLHVGMLHKSWMSRASAGRGVVSHPRYEVEDTVYGIRAAALRDIGGGEQYIRTTEYVMPFVSLVPNSGQRMGTMFMAVPIDNHSHLLFWGLWNEDGACAEQAAVVCAEPRDMNNYALLDGSKANVWRQDRAAMADGHFTGFDKCLLDEDMVVQASMGVITDRTREQLSPSDLGLVRARTRLLADLAAFEDGRLAHAQSAIIRPVDCVASQQQDWREMGSVHRTDPDIR